MDVTEEIRTLVKILQRMGTPDAEGRLTVRKLPPGEVGPELQASPAARLSACSRRRVHVPGPLSRPLWPGPFR